MLLLGSKEAPSSACLPDTGRRLQTVLSNFNSFSLICWLPQFFARALVAGVHYLEVPPAGDALDYPFMCVTIARQVRRPADSLRIAQHVALPESSSARSAPCTMRHWLCIAMPKGREVRHGLCRRPKAPPVLQTQFNQSNTPALLQVTHLQDSSTSIRAAQNCALLLRHCR